MVAVSGRVVDSLSQAFAGGFACLFRDFSPSLLPFFRSRSSRQINQRPQSLLLVRIRTLSLFKCLLRALELVLPNEVGA
jgi:hypothetical protein